MRLPLILAALAASLTVVLWMVLSSITQPTAPARGPHPERSAERTSSDRAHVPPQDAGARRASARTEPPSSVTAAAPAERTPDASAVLELVVLERHSRKPLPGFGLELRQAGLEERLVTDAAGRARSAARWTRGVVSLWHRPGGEARSYRAAWELEPWQVELSGRAESRQAVVLAERPELVLEVETADRDGTPLEGVEVSLIHGWRDQEAGFHSEWVDLERSDAQGRARFALFAAQASDDALMLVATLREQRLASAASFLDPPHSAGPWRLVLEPTGTVLVRAFDPRGLPLARGFARARSDEVVEAAMTSAGGRIEAGQGRLSGLGPGRWRVCASSDELDDERWIEVAVEGGRETTVEVRFDDGTTALAAAGHVLDEDGRPLQGAHVWLDVQGRAPRFTRSGADGGFRFVARPAAEVVVGTSSDVSSDAFEPAELRVPYGSTDLVLRRSRELRWRRLDFEVVDLETGQPPEEDCGVFVLLGAPRALGGWAWEPLVEGRARIEVKDHEELRWRVQCPGYTSREGRIPRRDEQGADAPIRALLERGFERRLTIVDSIAGLPLAGVRVSDPAGSCAGTSDERGVVRLVGSSWPPRLHLERKGYRERRIDPRDPELVGDRVALEPLAGR